MEKIIQLACCVCGKDFTTRARGIVVARLRAHAKGWASTSMDSPTAIDICGSGTGGEVMLREDGTIETGIERHWREED